MTDIQDTQQRLSDQESIENLRRDVVQLAHGAADASDEELVVAAAAVADLLSIAALFADDSATHDRSAEILNFCRREALPAMTETEPRGSVEDIQQQIECRWNDCLSLLAPEERFTCQQNFNWAEADSDDWGSLPTSAAANSNSGDGEEATSTPIDVESILASLAEAENQSDKPGTQCASSAARCNTEDNPLPQPPQEVETIDDPEMVAAFADDAQQCLAEMEASLLSLETEHEADEALRNFCRQLHTLKGASGTVGLSQLAGYLHNLESYVETASGNDIDVDKLLEGVDAVRAQLDTPGISTAASSMFPSSDSAAENCENNAAAQPQLHSAGESSAAAKPSPLATSSEGEIFVRVEAKRLERLMDLLAELVMLRNGRDTYVESLRTIHGELNHCASRTRALTSTVELSTSTSSAMDDSENVDSRGPTAETRLLTRSLDEVAKDTAELSRSLAEVCDPLSDDNSTVSHLIGRFRQELMELHRLPVGGLFQRLQRAIRDAAKAEGKQVQIRFEGQGARAERAVQERLFEPLLHLVRNAVSHGIQPADDRVRSEKPAAGTITLAAWSDATSLHIEVRDDGQGLNEEALEARGRELGLLPLDETVSRAQLRMLIFHPGFSTKSSVSEISGRGVGMDVVDSWVRRLRGRIDVETVAGQGTTFRLQIPLRSAVEHAMVVRAGGQLFALPMHTVSGTSDSRVPLSGRPDATSNAGAVPLTRILGSKDGQKTRGCHVTLRNSAQNSKRAQRGADNNVTIAVDAVVGVEEVVVRSLPPMLQRNELFAGVTLSGRAETVLLLDVRRLLELSQTVEPADSEHSQGSEEEHSAFDGLQNTNPEIHCRFLVVDDSVTVRRSLSKKLGAMGYDVDEASNGREALGILRTGGFAAVVTDIDMPGMSGIELLQEIKRQKQLQEIPVTVLTSRDAESIRPEIMHLQPAAILSKPVTDGTVAAIVESITGVRCLHS